MTEVEAIEVLEKIRRDIGIPAFSTKTGEAISMAIMALEKEKSGSWLEQKLRDLGDKDLEVRLIYKNDLNGIVAMVTWHKPEDVTTLRTERLIRFDELHAPAPFDVDSIFEFNLSNILGNMATKILAYAKHYK